jgi:hypothetical protein
MAKFELFVNELVNHQHRVIVEAESEDEVEGALQHADDCGEERADDYIYRLREKLTVLEHDDEYSVEPKEVECDDFNEMPTEDESEDEL